MPKIVFKAGTVIFAGSHPEHTEKAKEYCKNNGYTKDDVRIYKQRYETPYHGADPAYKGKVFEHYSVLVETIRPIAVDCGIVGCKNHETQED